MLRVCSVLFDDRVETEISVCLETQKLLSQWPLTGQHSQPSSLPICVTQGQGVDALVKGSVHSTSVGAFVNGWRGCVPWWLMVYIGEWAAEWSHLKCLQSFRARLQFRYPTSSGRNWMATRCPQTVDLRMATW